ncbi:MAG: hypothetical protein ACOYL6_17110 [Bacteriovoracaceae bacterium]
MSFLYHLKPIPFEGTSLIPLNMMDRDSVLYKSHAQKYVGRESLMEEIIPILNCKWNDAVQFSALDPQIIVNKLKTIDLDLQLFRFEYFKIHIDQIISSHTAVISNGKSGNDITVSSLLPSYQEILEVPQPTIDYWNQVKEKSGKYLWFPFIPHIFVKGILETVNFEVCKLKL